MCRADVSLWVRTWAKGGCSLSHWSNSSTAATKHQQSSESYFNATEFRVGSLGGREPQSTTNQNSPTRQFQFHIRSIASGRGGDREWRSASSP